MKHKLKIALLSLFSVYVLYKIGREIFWVKRTNHTIGNEIKIKTRTDNQILVFLDPISEKTIEVQNIKTKSSLKLEFESLESGTSFFIDTMLKDSVFVIADKFAGAGKYNFATLKLIGEDCFKEFGGCGGCNDSCFLQFGKPLLVIK